MSHVSLWPPFLSRRGFWARAISVASLVLAFSILGDTRAEQTQNGKRPIFRVLPAMPLTNVKDSSLKFAEPSAPAEKSAAKRGADWLAAHAVDVLIDEQERLTLIAWWDPTLSPSKSDLVAYTVSDNLWAAWALRPYRPDLSTAILNSLGRLGAQSNGFMDQPFHILPAFHGRCTSGDPVHGTLIASAVSLDAEGKPRSSLQIRAPQYAPFQDHKQDEHLASSFTDAAVYYAFFLFWHGKREKARRLLISCMKNDGEFGIAFDRRFGVLVDAADREMIRRSFDKTHTTMRYAPFKQALFLLAARVIGLENNGVDRAVTQALERRILDAQRSDGSFAHAVTLSYRNDEITVCNRFGGTAETTAICMLALSALPCNEGGEEPPK